MKAPRRKSAASVRAQLRQRSSAGKAAVLARFFKTGKGEYAEGDRFRGVMVPEIRRVAQAHQELPFRQIAALLRSPFHEDRVCALMIMTMQSARADEAGRARMCREYLSHTAGINNWDLVDLSAPLIVGAALWGKDTAALDRLARSPCLWERRIAVVATWYFIRRGRFGETLRIARTLLGDRHDLIHKATGWMLREVGKRDRGLAERFVRRHIRRMPRTMLRYAIERFPPLVRRRYLTL